MAAGSAAAGSAAAGSAAAAGLASDVKLAPKLRRDIGADAMNQLGCADMAELVTDALLLPADGEAEGGSAVAGTAAVAAAVEQHAEQEEEEHSEHAVNLGVALVLGLLLVALVLGHALEVRHVKALHEAGGALLVGVAGGAVLRWYPSSVTHAAVLGVARFDERFFFFVSKN